MGAVQPSITPFPKFMKNIFSIQILKRQFDQASEHLKNHHEELSSKIVSVVENVMQKYIAKWEPPTKPGQLPSFGFKVMKENYPEFIPSWKNVFPFRR